MEVERNPNWWVRLRHPEWWVDGIVGSTLDPQDAVVVTGFWRSGTTWLQQVVCRALSAKAVLEPLRYSVDAYYPVLEEMGVADRRPDYLDPYLPYTSSSLARSPRLHRYLRNALVSTIPGFPVRLPRFSMRDPNGAFSESRWARSGRRIAEAFRFRVVTKFTRAHLLLDAIAGEIGPDIIHVRRDPRAVVNSFRQIGWTWPRSFSLEAHLLRPSDGRSSLFSSRSDFIRGLDTEPPHARVAAYWGLLETRAQQVIERRGIRCIRYRDLVEGGVDFARRQLTPIIGADIDGSFLNSESWSSTAGSNGKSTQDRLYGWKEGLDKSEVAEVEAAVRRVGAEGLV